jgi:putative addiction module component (TIGR02574 family)
MRVIVRVYRRGARPIEIAVAAPSARAIEIAVGGVKPAADPVGSFGGVTPLSQVDNRARRAHVTDMVSSERVQRVLAAASALSTEEREELVAELVLGLECDRNPEVGYDEAWSVEIRRRVDAVVSGRSTGSPWSRVRRDIEAQLTERQRRRSA